MLSSLRGSKNYMIQLSSLKELIQICGCGCACEIKASQWVWGAGLQRGSRH